jgi:DNA-binding XRE family transcriptional regulator
MQSTSDEELADAIERRRVALGASHTEMAKRIGVSYPTYLHHRKDPSIELSPRTRALMLRQVSAPAPPLSLDLSTMAHIERLRTTRGLSYLAIAAELGIAITSATRVDAERSSPERRSAAFRK